ncbi:MAG: iron-containing alcohol dehydrogenase [Candidatus Brocadiia bacterium]|jgi:alcohol dehydrogenase class IV
MKFDLVFPRKILFGTGTFSRLGEVCRGNGRRTLLVTGRSALRRSGKLAQAEEMLAAAGIAVRLFEGVENDPSLATCDRAIAAARDAGCDMVVSIGGGSALDAGKIVAAMLPQSFTVREFFRGQRNLERPSLFFAAAPTTAGTGSECTRVSVLTDEVTQTKKGIRHEFMVPQAALVDPELTLALPPDVTAQSGMDALTQAIECFVGRIANPASDALALQAIELLARHLPAAVEDGSKIENREPVALGSLLTGLAFTNAALGAVHGLAHPVGALFHVPHGLACALLLPQVCEFNLPAQPEKFDRIAERIGCKSGREVPAALNALNRRVGITGGLERFGVEESAFPRILAESRSGSTANNPRVPTDADLVEILRKTI